MIDPMSDTMRAPALEEKGAIGGTEGPGLTDMEFSAVVAAASRVAEELKADEPEVSDLLSRAVLKLLGWEERHKGSKD